MNQQLSIFEEQATLHVPQSQEEKITDQNFKVNTYELKRHKTSDTILSHHEPIKSPGDAAGSLRHIFDTDSMTKEHLFMVSLDVKNRITAAAVVHIGALSSSIVHPREIFQHAILDNAASIIIGHNHPSGDITPSREDDAVTDRIVKAGKLLGIACLDHVILGEGRGNFYSYAEKGKI